MADDRVWVRVEVEDLGNRRVPVTSLERYAAVVIDGTAAWSLRIRRSATGTGWEAKFLVDEAPELISGAVFEMCEGANCPTARIVVS